MVSLNVHVTAHDRLQSPIVGFLVKDRLGQSLFGHNTFREGKPVIPLLPGDEACAKFTFQLPLLPNGEYSITVALADGDLFDHVQHHWMHDAVLVAVCSSNQRYGLVGIPFESITFDVNQHR